MALDSLDCLLGLVAFHLHTILLVVVGVVAGVKDIVFNGVRVVCQGLKMVGTDEPLRLSIFSWQSTNNILLIVICRQI